MPRNSAQQCGSVTVDQSPVRAVGLKVARQAIRAKFLRDPGDGPFVPVPSEEREEDSVSGKTYDQQAERRHPVFVAQFFQHAVNPPR
ncbi:MAG: hypothetical protein GX577_15195 [Leptolinea sp.]|nr:hypothetical protein [Leptolinea sp.]